MSNIVSLLGNEGDKLLGHVCRGVPKESVHVPGPDFVDRVFSQTDRAPMVLRNMQQLMNNGRLAGTGYVSILPVDQGIEHSAGASFAPNPLYFDPENIVQAGDRGRLQRGGVDPGRARLGVAQVRAQDPVHPEVQPQRVSELPEHLRPDRCSPAWSRPSTWARSPSARPIYFGSPESRAPDLGGVAGLPARPRTRHGHDPLVLPAQSRLQEGRHRLPRVGGPDRPGEPSGRDDRGRHHQAEDAREQRRLQRGEVRQDACQGL